jgi:hypothetical protein
MRAFSRLRRRSHCVISEIRVGLSPMRRLRHWRTITPISISTMLSQLACLGVKWNSRRLRIRRVRLSELNYVLDLAFRVKGGDPFAMMDLANETGHPRVAGFVGFSLELWGAVLPFLDGIGAVAGELDTAVVASDNVVAGEAGSYSSLRARAKVGDDLTPHHMPQVAMEFTTRGEGGAALAARAASCALVLPKAEHELTRTFSGRGAVTVRADRGRDVLARDMHDVRQLFGSKYDQGLRDLLQYYKLNFPGLMAR